MSPPTKTHIDKADSYKNRKTKPNTPRPTHIQKTSIPSTDKPPPNLTKYKKIQHPSHTKSAPPTHSIKPKLACTSKWWGASYWRAIRHQAPFAQKQQRAMAVANDRSQFFFHKEYAIASCEYQIANIDSQSVPICRRDGTSASA